MLQPGETGRIRTARTTDALTRAKAASDAKAEQRARAWMERGTWVADTRYRDIFGKRVQVGRFGRTERDAREAVITEIARRQEAGGTALNDAQSVSQLVDWWEREMLPLKQVREQSRSKDKQIAKFIADRIGDLRLFEVTIPRAELLLDTLAKEGYRDRLKKVRNLAQQIWHDALVRQAVSNNPWMLALAPGQMRNPLVEAPSSRARLCEPAFATCPQPVQPVSARMLFRGAFGRVSRPACTPQPLRELAALQREGGSAHKTVNRGCSALRHLDGFPAVARRRDYHLVVGFGHHIGLVRDIQVTGLLDLEVSATHSFEHRPELVIESLHRGRHRHLADVLLLLRGGPLLSSCRDSAERAEVGFRCRLALRFLVGGAVVPLELLVAAGALAAKEAVVIEGNRHCNVHLLISAYELFLVELDAVGGLAAQTNREVGARHLAERCGHALEDADGFARRQLRNRSISRGPEHVVRVELLGGQLVDRSRTVVRHDDVRELVTSAFMQANG